MIYQDNTHAIWIRMGSDMTKCISINITYDMFLYVLIFSSTMKSGRPPRGLPPHHPLHPPIALVVLFPHLHITQRPLHDTHYLKHLPGDVLPRGVLVCSTTSRNTPSFPPRPLHSFVAITAPLNSTHPHSRYGSWIPPAQQL